MSLEEGGDTPVGDSVPDLDAAVSGAADEMFACVAPPETGDIPGVVVGGDGAHEALSGVDVVHPDDWRGGSRHYGDHILSSVLTVVRPYQDSLR